MARVPLRQIETGPIIAPALKAATQIREGRARASMLEETARTYPEERRTALDAQKEKLAQSKFKTKTDVAGEERAVAQRGEAKTLNELNAAKGMVEYRKKIMEDVTDPQEYMRRRDVAIKANPTMEGLIDELTEEEMTPEGFLKSKEKEAADLLRLDNELQFKFEELETRKRGQDIQVKVAEIYAERPKRNLSDFSGSDKRLIYQGIRQEYRDEFQEWVPPSIPGDKGYYRDKPNAPEGGFNKKWQNQRYRENIKELGGESAGPKPTLDY